MLCIDVITVMPSIIDAVVGSGVTGRAVSRGLIEVNTWDPREQTSDAHRTIDDRPFGGGPGMVMLAAPLEATLERLRHGRAGGATHVAYLSPQGERLDQGGIRRLGRHTHLVLLAGRYEGVDERFIAHRVDSEWSLGDYVLSGGELGAAVIIDALARLQPGALNTAESADQDSFSAGLLDCPHYTRPERVLDREAPAVLRGGDHGAVKAWRRDRALERTWLRRPDLLARRALTCDEASRFATVRRNTIEPGCEPLAPAGD